MNMLTRRLTTLLKIRAEERKLVALVAALGVGQSLLEKSAGDGVTANALARGAALRVLRRDPAGVARLALLNALDYLDLKADILLL